ncbi:MAG: ATP-grasp domain-containing protein [Lachnospiraceae bacterium]
MAYMLLPATIYRIILHINIQMNTVTSVLLIRKKTLDAARKLNIDGIMSFACDPGVVTAAYVAEQMGLPNVGPYESVCILQNKGKFREFLTKNGFNVPTAKGYKNAAAALKDIEMFHWPVIVKPTDSAGSKGVTKVDKPKDLGGKHSICIIILAF